LAPRKAAKALPSATHSSRPANSMGWTRKAGWHMSWPTSKTWNSQTSTNCCRGTMLRKV